MSERHHRAWLAATVVLVLAVFAFTRPAVAQELDEYHQFMLQMLEDEYNITGGELVLNPSMDQKLDSPGGYGHTLRERRAGDPFDQHPFDYVHVEAPAAGDPWGAGISWPTNVPITNGDVMLAVLLIRGETTTGGNGTVNMVFERGVEPYDKSTSLDGINLSAEWSLIVHPFEVHDNFDAGAAQLGFHLSINEQYIDFTAPIVVNFKNKYSVGVLDGMIKSGGQIPLLASFTQDVQRGVPPFTVNFDASGSTAPGTITNYSWNFGDGSVGTGVTTSHQYTEMGVYEVVLTITDNTGAKQTSTSAVVGFDGVGLPESPLEIPFTAEAPTIDGQAEAIWNNAVTVNIDFHVADNPPVDANDISGTASVMWDAQYLYALYRVTDDVLNNDSENSYQDDAADIYIDGLNEKSTTYDANDVQYEFSWYPADSLGAQRVTGNGISNGRGAGVEYSFSNTATGYIIEARIPWSNIETLPVPGAEIGIDFMLNDGDLLGDVRDTKLSWYSMQDLAHQNASLLATAKLVGGEGQILTAHFSITADAMMTELPITFDASQSVAPGTIVSYAWDFGDGSEGEGATVQHEYAAAGQYVVTLTITDDQDKTAQTTRTISISDGLGTPEKPLQIPLTDQAPVIDGQLDDIWLTNAISVQLLTQLYNPLDAENDLLPTAYVMWDAEHIYVFYDIIDDVLVTNESAENERYKDDDVEFFLDPDNSKTPSAHDANDAQFSVRLDDPVMTGDAADKYPSTVFDMQRTDYGWTFEMAAKWSDVGHTPQMGDYIGIDFQVNDDDDGGERDHKASWFATEDQGWQWAHVFGTGILADKLVVGIEDEAGLPNRFAIESVYPNPFNPATTALVSVRELGAYEVRVFNVLGQLIEKRSLEVQQPGQIQVGFDFGTRASGLYLIQVEHKSTGKVVSAQAMLLK